MRPTDTHTNPIFSSNAAFLSSGISGSTSPWRYSFEPIIFSQMRMLRGRCASILASTALAIRGATRGSIGTPKAVQRISHSAIASTTASASLPLTASTFSTHSGTYSVPLVTNMGYFFSWLIRSTTVSFTSIKVV